MTGEEFKAKRHRLGWTQKEASSALGITTTQIAAMEHGRAKVTQMAAKLISFYHFGDRPNHPRGLVAEQTAAP